MRTIIATVCLIGIGCGPDTASPEGPKPETASVAKTEPRAAPPAPPPQPPPAPTPSPEAAARARASTLAREAFAQGVHVGADGEPVPTPAYAPEDFLVEREGDRWHLRNEPPAGAYAIVSFGPNGEDPKVEVGYATH